MSWSNSLVSEPSLLLIICLRTKCVVDKQTCLLQKKKKKMVRGLETAKSFFSCIILIMEIYNLATFKNVMQIH